MRYQEGIKDLKFNKSTKFVLAGLEPYLKEHFVRAAKFFNPDSEVNRYYPDMEKDAIEDLLSGSLFSPRIVVLKNFDKMHVKKFEEPIKNFDGIVLFLLTDRTNAVTKAVSKIVSISTKVDCGKMREYGNEYPLWIMSKARELKVNLSNGAEDIIYKRTGPNMYLLFNELKKLSWSGKEVITPEDVEKMVPQAAQDSSFDILNRLMSQDVAGALRSFESYSKNQDNFIEIVAFLASYVEKMIRALVLREGKIKPEDIAGILNISKYHMKSFYLPKALSLGKENLKAQYNNLCELDVNLRLYKGKKKFLFEKFIFGFAK